MPLIGCPCRLRNLTTPEIVPPSTSRASMWAFVVPKPVLIRPALVSVARPGHHCDRYALPRSQFGKKPMVYRPGSRPWNRYRPLRGVVTCWTNAPLAVAATTQTPRSPRPVCPVTFPEITPPRLMIPPMPRVIFPALITTVLAADSRNLARYHSGAQLADGVPNEESHAALNSTVYLPGGKYFPTRYRPTAPMDPVKPLPPDSISKHSPLTCRPFGRRTVPAMPPNRWLRT